MRRNSTKRLSIGEHRNMVQKMRGLGLAPLASHIALIMLAAFLKRSCYTIRSLSGVKQFGPQHGETILAMDWCAHNKENNGQLSEARDMYETILAWKTEIHGPNKGQTLTSLRELTETNFRLEDFPKAKEGFSLLLERSTAELGSEDESNITALTSLARTEMQLRNWSAAHEKFLRVLAWTKSNQGGQPEKDPQRGIRGFHSSHGHGPPGGG